MPEVWQVWRKYGESLVKVWGNYGLNMAEVWKKVWPISH